MPINPETNKTDGVAFVRMKNEEQARIAVQLFHGFKLAKKQFAACLMPDFDKIMKIEEAFKQEESADLKDLRAPVLDTKRDQYMYQSGRNVFVNYFSASSASNKSDENTVTVLENASEKPAIWSPQGTYVIVIKADKVVFLGGGGEMRTIITLKCPMVHSVIMSPCERYVLTYSPAADIVFTVWNYKMSEKIREFDYATGESEHTYSWSYDGNYLAKQFRTETEKDGQTKVKEGISVYTLPECALLENTDGQKKSITIADITEWRWAPARNLLIYATVPEEEDSNRDPQISFMTVPARRIIGVPNFRGSTKLKMFMHPLGKYLAVQNDYIKSKANKCNVEVFDLSKDLDVPHQPITIKRDIQEFYGISWEPVHGRFAVHTSAKREVEAGKRDYTFGALRNGVDLYQCFNDPDTGFNVRLLGFHPSEKTSDIKWSPAGELFAICEKDGIGSNTKSIWSTFLIVKSEQKAAEGLAHTKYEKFKGKIQKVIQTKT